MWTHFSLETMDTPNSGKKCSVIKYFFIFGHCFPKWVYQMNVLFPSLPCPQPHHLYTHRHNVSGGNRERDSKEEKTRPTLGTSQYSSELHTQCRGDWILSQQSREQKTVWVSWWGRERLYTTAETHKDYLGWGAAKWPRGQQSGKQHPCPWQPAVRQGDPVETVAKKGRALALWVFPQAQHQPGFLQTIRMVNVLEICHCIPKIAKQLLCLHENFPWN